MKYQMARVKLKCPNGHEKRYDIVMNQIHYCLPEVLNQIFKCDKCGTQGTVMSYPEFHGHYVKFYVPCPYHGDRKKKIDGVFYSYIDAYYRQQYANQYRAQQQLEYQKTISTKTVKPKSKTKSKVKTKVKPKSKKKTKSKAKSKKRSKQKLCPNCSQNLNWIKEYKKWYCYNCNIYP